MCCVGRLQFHKTIVSNWSDQAEQGKKKETSKFILYSIPKNALYNYKRVGKNKT